MIFRWAGSWDERENWAWGRQRKKEKPCDLFKSLTRLLSYSQISLCSPEENNKQQSGVLQKRLLNQNLNLEAPKPQLRPEAGSPGTEEHGSWTVLETTVCGPFIRTPTGRGSLLQEQASGGTLSSGRSVGRSLGSFTR